MVILQQHRPESDACVEAHVGSLRDSSAPGVADSCSSELPVSSSLPRALRGLWFVLWLSLM